MRLVLPLAVFGVLLVFSCKPKSSGGGSGDRDSTYLVEGFIEGLDSGQVNLVYYNKDTSIHNQARIEKGAFRLTGQVDYPQFAYLSIDGQADRGSVSFFLDNGKTHFRAQKDSLLFAGISGTAAQDEYKLYLLGIKPIEERLKELMNAYDSIPSSDFRRISDSLDRAYFRLTAEKAIAIKEYVRLHPESFVAAFEVVSNFYYDPKVDQLDSVYNFMGSTVRETPVGRRVLEMLTAAKRTDVGEMAPDFELKDVDEHPTRLSSMRGKITLVDFWASWCGPCREENPNVVEAYRKYHDRGFDVFGVSLDTKKAKWLQAIQQDHLTWKHVSDLKGWRSPTVKLYGIGGIPMSYLLDQEGRIIAKNPRGESLTKKLEGLLRASASQ